MFLRCVLCLVFLVTSVLADDESLPELKSLRTGGPYCGIHSLYFCLDSLGIKTNFEDFVSTRFVGSPRGSSAGELIDAAEHFGAHAILIFGKSAVNVPNYSVLLAFASITNVMSVNIERENYDSLHTVCELYSVSSDLRR